MQQSFNLSGTNQIVDNFFLLTEALFWAKLIFIKLNFEQEFLILLGMPEMELGAVEIKFWDHITIF